MKSVCLLLLVSVTALAQGVEVSAGDSTVMQASGAEAKLLFNNSETDISGGVFSGHVYGGVTEKTEWHGSSITVGDLLFPYQIKTDISNQVPLLSAMGLLVTKKTKTVRTSCFTGESATSIFLPYMFGSRGSTPTGGCLFSKDFGKMTLDSDEIFSSKMTAIQTLTLHTPVVLTAAIGLGGDALFAAAKAEYRNEHWHSEINYTKRSTSFQRVLLPNYTTVENNGLGLVQEFTSSHFSFGGYRTDYLSDLKTGLVQSTVNSVNSGGSYSFVNANGSFFFGGSNGEKISGETLGAGATFSAITVRANWYKSKNGSFDSLTVSEKLTRHISVNEFVQLHSVNVGGEYHSNLISVSGGYVVQYLPVTGSFAKVLSAQVTLQLPNASQLTAGTITTPTGGVRYSIYGNKYTEGSSQGGSTPYTHATIGKFSYTGAVVNETGVPVAGAALMLGKTEVFTNAAGVFLLPTNKQKTLPLAVILPDFMAVGQWKVITAPESISPEKDVQIVVTFLNP